MFTPTSRFVIAVVPSFETVTLNTIGSLMKWYDRDGVVAMLPALASVPLYTWKLSVLQLTPPKPDSLMTSSGSTHALIVTEQPVAFVTLNDTFNNFSVSSNNAVEKFVTFITRYVSFWK